MYRKYYKRFFDIIGAVLGLVITSPLLIGVAICLYIVNNGSPLFMQNRSGRNGKVFKILKFKTMTDECDENGELLPDCERLHKLGEFLRATSIDELPQLINILIGNMSFIGPRPLVEDYLPLYNSRHAHRHEVRPGMSGWAQVNGRNMISWAQKFEYDVWYIDHISIWLDLKIVWITLQIIMNRNGINPNTTTQAITLDTYCQRFHQLENR